jgi:hypothetical protein
MAEPKLEQKVTVEPDGQKLKFPKCPKAGQEIYDINLRRQRVADQLDDGVIPRMGNSINEAVNNSTSPSYSLARNIAAVHVNHSAQLMKLSSLEVSGKAAELGIKYAELGACAQTTREIEIGNRALDLGLGTPTKQRK